MKKKTKLLHLLKVLKRKRGKQENDAVSNNNYS